MKQILNALLLAGLLSGVPALSQAQAQGTDAAGPVPNKERRERMQDHVAKRATDIKAKLKLTPEQEGAWTSYAAAMKPSPHAKWPDRSEIDKLTTPQRLDKMRELRNQHDAEMDKRDAATRAFYATLSAEQKKTFDANTGRPFHNHRQQAPRKQ